MGSALSSAVRTSWMTRIAIRPGINHPHYRQRVIRATHSQIWPDYESMCTDTPVDE
ncbi:hypothetical protein OKW29_003458 [Paraburkholderia sp. CI3]